MAKQKVNLVSKDDLIIEDIRGSSKGGQGRRAHPDLFLAMRPGYVSQKYPNRPEL